VPHRLAEVTLGRRIDVGKHDIKILLQHVFSHRKQSRQHARKHAAKRVAHVEWHELNGGDEEPNG